MNAVLELEISAGPTAGSYTVHVLSSLAGGQPSTVVQLDPDAMIADLPQIEAGILASSVSARRVMTPHESVVQSIGVTLFDTVFTGRIGEAYRASAAVAAERGLAPQLALRLTAPELAALPWEVLFDSDADRYVSRKEPLVRRVSSRSSSRRGPIPAPLRILGMVSAPKGLQMLDVEAEKERLESALEEHIQEGLVELVWLDDTTWGGLHSKLLRETWHVLHFIGHGGYDPATDEGLIALVGKDGRADFVPASNFADLLNEASTAPRLVVLNSCQSGATGTADLFSGTAASLVHSGINAVVAMQFAVSDYAALAFARGFYVALASGRSIDQAVRSGRIAILGITRDTLEWVTPVLYLGGDDTRLLDPATLAPRARATGPAPVVVPAAAAAPSAEPAAEPSASEPADLVEPDVPPVAQDAPAAAGGDAPVDETAPTIADTVPVEGIPDAAAGGSDEVRDAVPSAARTDDLPRARGSDTVRPEAPDGPVDRGLITELAEDPSPAAARSTPASPPVLPPPPGSSAAPSTSGAATPPRRRRAPLLVAGIVAGALILGGGAWALIAALDPSGGSGTSDDRAVVDGPVVSVIDAVVPGTVEWTPTGVLCGVDDDLTISAEGTVMHAPDPTTGVGPDGTMESPYLQFNVPGLPDSPHAGLIGRIGDQPPFFVGAQFDGVCPASGPLFLGVNDVGVANNGGRFFAQISTTAAVDEVAMPTVDDDVSLDVSAAAPWTATGVTCRLGDILEISATGELFHDASPTSNVSPRGLILADGTPDPAYLPFNVEGLPDTATASLIGSLDGQQPFFAVGPMKTYTCERDGELYLGINDTGLDGNSGAWQAVVTKTAIPPQG